MSNHASEICVVHLVRAQNGIKPLRDFLESYKLNPGGIEHNLIVLFKGFKSEGPTQEYRLLLQPFRYQELHVSDQGFDITAYFAVPHSFEYKYYCFLNSFSVFTDSEWLLKFYRHISREEAGMVGATGSYQSLNPDAKQCKLLAEKSITTSSYPKLRRFWIDSSGWTLHYKINEWRFGSSFPQFPNYHIRSNAFMVRQEVIRNIVCPKIRNKIDAYKCESGNQSITRQVLELGQEILVVGKDGKGYKKEDWWKSNTFWRESQENLLVSDNQTRAYANCDLAQKIRMSYSAWGDRSIT